LHIKIVGLDHVLQWKDTDEKHLQSLLSTLFGASPRVELIAEEAYKLPTTVAQRLACRLNIPWKEVDMDDLERQRAGIHDALQTRGGSPLMDDDDGYTMSYLEQADELREQNWVDKIRRYRVQSVIFLCGLLHLTTVATKFRTRGWDVQEINICDLDWYKSRFGTLTVLEEAGQRWCECRPNSKM
jgi:hypothetical protein